MDAAANILVRWALAADLMLLFGVPLFAVHSSSGNFAGIWPGLRRLIIAAVSIGLALSVTGIATLAASMSGVAIGDVRLESISTILAETAVGSAFIVRSMALVGAGALGLAQRCNRAIGPCIIMLGAVALASLAWSGHGAMDSGPTGALHLGADIVHLLAAGVWVGALAALLWRLRTTHRNAAAEAHRALAAFATPGSISVGLIVVSGLINSWLLVGPDKLLSLMQSLYGQLLMTKLALFAGMLALAAWNRFRLTPALGAGLAGPDFRRPMWHLRLSLGLETLAAVVILGLVAWLGTLDPLTVGGSR